MSDRRRDVADSSSGSSDSYSESASSSEEVTEDENGAELTPALDAAILRTLGRIKRGDGVYGSEDVLSEALREAELKAGALRLIPHGGIAKTGKPYLLSDHHRANLLSKSVEVEDEPRIEALTNVQSERLLRADAISAFHALADEAEEQNCDFEPKKREKDEDEALADDEEYRRFLLEMGGGEDEVRRVLGMGDQPVNGLRPISDEDEIDDGEEKEEEEAKVNVGWAKGHVKRTARKTEVDDNFLMNYILNRGWIDRSDRHVPTYHEVIGESQDKGDAGAEQNEVGPSHPWGELDEDEFDDKADEFEAAYNFRFEEPGSTAISTHPRIIPTLVRRADDARKVKRAARAERKAAESATQEEETRRLKGKKRREAEKMLAGLRKELGDQVDWEEVEKVLEGEWDEQEWERIVGGMLSLAREDEAEGEGKPVWDDNDIEMDHNEETDWAAANAAETNLSTDTNGQDKITVNMDADYIYAAPAKKRKQDKKGKRRIVEDAEGGMGLTLEDKAIRVKQAMDEYNALDHEDMIGELPTRFKYTQSAPANFGLSPVEILLATDAELNTIAPVKTLAPYRRGLGMAGKGMGKRVRELKDELRKRKWAEVTAIRSLKQRGGTGNNEIPLGSGKEGEEKRERKGRRLGRKERMKMKVVEETEPQSQVERNSQQPLVGTDDGDAGKDLDKGGQGGREGEAKKRRKKKKKGRADDASLQVFD